jgi:hypothetical protein
MGYCVAPTGLLDRGCWGNGSALSWFAFVSGFARSEILRVAQNDKGTGEAFLLSFCYRSTQDDKGYEGGFSAIFLFAVPSN